VTGNTHFQNFFAPARSSECGQRGTVDAALGWERAGRFSTPPPAVFYMGRKEAKKVLACLAALDAVNLGHRGFTNPSRGTRRELGQRGQRGWEGEGPTGDPTNRNASLLGGTDPEQKISVEQTGVSVNGGKKAKKIGWIWVGKEDLITQLQRRVEIFSRSGQNNLFGMGKAQAGSRKRNVGTRPPPHFNKGVAKLPTAHRRKGFGGGPPGPRGRTERRRVCSSREGGAETRKGTKFGLGNLTPGDRAVING